VFAESVDKVNGLETTDDRVFITLRHADGSVSNVSYQAGGDRAAPVERIMVDGGGRTGFIDAWDSVEMWGGNKVTRARGSKDKGHEAEFKRFVEVCRAGGAWPIPWEHIYGTTWASLAAVRSLREGLPVDLDTDE
ncbi:MAG: alcohol dehydrogenase, partial [Acidobacteriota bacterium]|nr:alcohol dehydrogenase [Acidobacteriota bacterium]